MKKIHVSGVYQCRELPLEFHVGDGKITGPDFYTRTIVTTQDWGDTWQIQKKRESTASIKERLLESHG